MINSHIYNPILTGGNKPSIVKQLGSPSRHTATVKCATIILRDEFESLCERALQLFFLEHSACAGNRTDDFVGDQISRLAQSGGGDLNEPSRRFSEAAIMGLECSQDPTDVRDKTEAAYRRTDSFDRRRDLMESWYRFATSIPAGIVTVQT